MVKMTVVMGVAVEIVESVVVPVTQEVIGKAVLAVVPCWRCRCS